MKQTATNIIFTITVFTLTLPIMAFIIPKVSSAPTWSENPFWYASSAAAGIFLYYAAAFLKSKLMAVSPKQPK